MVKLVKGRNSSFEVFEDEIFILSGALLVIIIFHYFLSGALLKHLLMTLANKLLKMLSNVRLDVEFILLKITEETLKIRSLTLNGHEYVRL